MRRGNECHSINALPRHACTRRECQMVGLPSLQDVVMYLSRCCARAARFIWVQLNVALNHIRSGVRRGGRVPSTSHSQSTVHAAMFKSRLFACLLFAFAVTSATGARAASFD